MAAPDAAGKAGPPATPATRICVANLVLLICLGTAVSLWILGRSDWFPAFGGMLALGGLLSWLALVTKILPETLVEDFQAHVYRTLLRKELLGIQGAVFLALCLLAAQLASVEVRAGGESQARLVSVHASNGGTPGSEELTAGGTRRFVRWVPPLGVRHYTVAVSGYPAIQVALGAFGMTTVDVPRSFFRRVILLRCSADLLNELEAWDEPATLEIGGPEGKHLKPGFRGESLWIGCDEKVEIPDYLMRSLLAEADRLVQQGESQAPLIPVILRPRLLFPARADAALAETSLTAGQTFEVNIRNAKGEYYYSKPYRITVRPLAPPEDFVQLETLDLLRRGS